MNFQQRVESFVHLGQLMRHLSMGGEESPTPLISQRKWEKLNHLIQTVHHHNGWFTENNVRQAIGALGKELTEKKILSWTGAYTCSEETDPLTIGIIMAGNLPLVGFHDLLSACLSGHNARVKLSTDDNQLMPALFNIMCQWDPTCADYISFTEGKIKGIDAIIATGSDNTARYFDYYFKDIPRAIRSNRNSVAILDGSESQQDLEALGHDIFSFFGHGCRSVSKLYVPSGYEFNTLFKALYEYREIINHHKYANNYDYNKAIWLLNRESLLDNGFLILKQDESVSSPTASLYYEFYDKKDQVMQKLEHLKDQIQCVVSKQHTQFGHSQQPGLKDYADGFDTMEWLTQLPAQVK